MPEEGGRVDQRGLSGAVHIRLRKRRDRGGGEERVTVRDGGVDSLARTAAEGHAVHGRRADGHPVPDPLRHRIHLPHESRSSRHFLLPRSLGYVIPANLDARGMC